MAMADYGQVTQLWQQAGLPCRPKGRDSAHAIERELARFPGLLNVAEAAGKVVGVAIGTHDGRRGWINRLAVDPDYRRSQVASRLVRTLEERFQELGLQIFSAMVFVDNEAGQQLFARMGYQRATDVHLFNRRLEPDA